MNKNLQSKIERFSYYAENCVNYVTATIKEKHNHRKTSETLTKLYEKKKKRQRNKSSTKDQVCDKRNQPRRHFFKPNIFFYVCSHFFHIFHRIFLTFKKKNQNYKIKSSENWMNIHIFEA